MNFLKKILSFIINLSYFIYSFLRINFDKKNKVFININENYRKICFYPPWGLLLKLKGKNNIVNINYPYKFKNCKIRMDCDNGKISIGKKCSLAKTIIFLERGESPVIEIGDYCTSVKLCIFSRGKKSLIIESDCMFANNILIRLTDSHLIFKRGTDEVINKQKNCAYIGHHSWIGEDVRILKNAYIAPNSIVGIGSVVSGAFQEEYTCIAGNPAKIIKRDVVWSREMD